MVSFSKDHLILLLLSQDDGKALSLLQEIYGSELLALAYGMVEIKEEAEDILQEVYLTIWEKRHRLKLTPPIRNYLTKMVINACIDYFRNAHTRKASQTDQSLELQPAITNTNNSNFILLKDMLKKTKAELPPRTRIAFILSRSLNMSYKEIAYTWAYPRKE
ncbi:sigma-70 family RNA polymerase sigma factor [Fulvivirga ligni]|uniref:sigma-70 family RNA polymerase sigma factor n=1 Tax=Fulvivirga ligni TaxID=2904246 RepID=UPI001F1CC692|nr:sigma-70 family RNA polymerase sigma factor [Fulvivirga ligni]UII20860.1 sigma-70 family RNA polymerase sigma factor [Fulvivirga ligni]